MKAYCLSPLDTWFFRDGRPYNMNESSQVNVKSIFPPSAYTVVGAMRASLARAMGWNGKSQDRWSNDIVSYLGDGRNDLGGLRFFGPYIHSEKHGGLLFPAPLHMIGAKNSAYVFRWDRIPGMDNKRLICFLIQEFAIGWVKTAEIERTGTSKAIKISTKENFLLLKLNDGDTEVILEIDGFRTHRFLAKRENGELNIYSSLKSWSFARLRPKDSKDAIDCDLGGGVRLPSAGDGIKGLKTFGDYYLTAKDLDVILSGGDLNDVCPIHFRELWDLEYWLGLRRNSVTLTTEDRALFSKYHVRLAPGVSLMMMLDSPDGLVDLEPLLALGGENRVACSRIMDVEPKLPAQPELYVDGDKIRFTLTHLTPAYLEGAWPGPDGHLPGVPGKVISACLERPLFLGGWDSLRGKHGEPLPLRPYVPSGSTWFFEADAKEKRAIELLHLSHIGEDADYGFGQIAVGLW